MSRPIMNMHQHRMCTQNACFYKIGHYCNVVPMHIIPHTHTLFCAAGMALDNISFVLVYIYIYIYIVQHLHITLQNST